jgi:tetratricopeptide (TPR) repeat protein
MDNLEYIESYFTNNPDNDRTREFEKRIESDPSFAEEVAFYLNVLKVSREESESDKKRRFKEIYQKNPVDETMHVRNISGGRVRKLVYYIAAAAAVAGIVFGIRTFTSSASPQQLADKYINENLSTLGVTMSGRADSIQTGLQLYNSGKFQESRVQFEKIIQSDTSNFTAKEYAGLAALRMKEYDKALAWFNELETYSLNSNPALLYQSLTLMERNQSGDAAKAKQLLQQVVQNDLEGKETAQEWLRKW